MAKKPKTARKRQIRPKARPARRALTTPQELEVVAAFLRGDPQADLAERFGVGVNTVARCLRRHGATAEARERSGARPARAAGAVEGADPTATALLERVGEPPIGNVLESSAWLYRALVSAASAALRDSSIVERQRRKELVAIARAAGTVFPLATLTEATKLIEEERGLVKKFDLDVPLVSAAELDAADRARGREPATCINADSSDGGDGGSDDR